MGDRAHRGGGTSLATRGGKTGGPPMLLGVWNSDILPAAAFVYRESSIF
jgi:hypothetical protein